MDKQRKVLFVCSRNQWRSPTAEQVWNQHPAVTCRSAGTSPRARKPITAQDIRWADIIYVMEPKHRDRLKARFGGLLVHKPLEVLDIPDQYRYMNPDLVRIFEAELEVFVSS